MMPCAGRILLIVGFFAFGVLMSLPASGDDSFTGVEVIGHRMDDIAAIEAPVNALMNVDKLSFPPLNTTITRPQIADPCFATTCVLAAANALRACASQPSGEVGAEAMRGVGQAGQGDMRRQCEATERMARKASDENKKFALDCGVSILIMGYACRANLRSCGICQSTPGGQVQGATCIAAIGTKIGLLAGFGMRAYNAHQQAKSLSEVADGARRCEADVRGRSCTTFADFESKPECRFELCPNVSTTQGLSAEQVQQRVLQALESFRSRGLGYSLTDSDRSRVCSVASANCQNPDFRDDPVCRCEREPSGPGCRNIASVTTTTRPGSGGGPANENGPLNGGGSPTAGGPPSNGSDPNAGGFPTSGGPNNPSFTNNGDGVTDGNSLNISGGSGNSSNDKGLRMTVGGDGSGGGAGAGGGGSGGSALGGGGPSGGGPSDGGSSLNGTGTFAASASEGDAFSAGGFGDGAEGGGGSVGSGGRSFNPNMSFGGAGGYRKPGAAGLSVNHGQDRIGVSGENMFLMIERQYKRQRSLGTLLPEGP